MTSVVITEPANAGSKIGRASRSKSATLPASCPALGGDEKLLDAATSRRLALQRAISLGAEHRATSARGSHHTTH